MRRLRASAAEEETYLGRTTKKKKKKKVTFPRTCEVYGLFARSQAEIWRISSMEKTTVPTAAGPTVASQLTSEQIIVVVASGE